jgi:FAD/FMN-containing dehydrogenase
LRRPDEEKQNMDQSERTLHRLGAQLPGRLSRPGDDRYAAAMAIWAMPIGVAPRVVVHCRTAEDVQAAVRAARDSDLPLSVRGGGHDWAGRALCDGIVIDLSGMNGAVVDPDKHIALISGGARASDVAAVADRLGLAAVSGSVGCVGMAGLTLGGGYGPLIARFGLALDSLLAAEVVLADGRIVTAGSGSEEELFWALRGGGGNFGVVTAMHHRLHQVSSVRSGILFYPFSEAKAVLQGCVDRMASLPEDLTVQLGFVMGPKGKPVVIVAPTWSGAPEEGEARVGPFLKLGTLLAGDVEATAYGVSLNAFAPYIVNGLRTFMETCSLPTLDSGSIDLMIQAMETAVGPGCAIFTHEFRGAASRVPEEATAFGLRRDHTLIEILAQLPDPWNEFSEHQHQQWAKTTLRSFGAMALPGGYPNFLTAGDADRVAKSYGYNAGRLIKAKRRYDPDNVFRSATPLPNGQHHRRASLRQTVEAL